MEKFGMKLCLVRHGETEENLARIFQGRMPGTLTEKGRQQAIGLRDKIDLGVFDAIVSSDLKRVVDTVNLLLDGRLMDWERNLLFREIDWGSLTGLRIADADLNNMPADVETREMLYERAGEAAQYLKGNYRGKAVLVVSHGLFLRSLIAQLTDVPVSQLHTIERIDNCEARWFNV